MLEIGAGVGLAGIALACLGAKVCLTDYKSEILRLLDENIQANSLGARASSALLDWSEPTNHRRQVGQPEYDFIVLADVLYYDTGDAPGLIPTLLAKASLSTRIILAYEDRQSRESLAFFGDAKEYFRVEPIQLCTEVRREAGRRNCRAVQLFELARRSLTNET